MTEDTCRELLEEVADAITKQLSLYEGTVGFTTPGPELVAACLRTVAQKDAPEIGNGDTALKRCQQRQEDSRRAESLEQAFVDAIPHVRRQLQGRHEQDRKDAEEWLATWDSLIRISTFSFEKDRA